jgi:hypothetical protein
MLFVTLDTALGVDKNCQENPTTEYIEAMKRLINFINEFIPKNRKNLTWPTSVKL